MAGQCVAQAADWSRLAKRLGRQRPALTLALRRPRLAEARGSLRASWPQRPTLTLALRSRLVFDIEAHAAIIRWPSARWKAIASS
eukprot:scaffold57761_cov62-Phaeocystis_antarctica.AAC.2